MMSLSLSLTKLSFRQPFLIRLFKNFPLKRILITIRFSSNTQTVWYCANFRYFISLSKIVWLKIFLFYSDVEVDHGNLNPEPLTCYSIL